MAEDLRGSGNLAGLQPAELLRISRMLVDHHLHKPRRVHVQHRALTGSYRSLLDRVLLEDDGLGVPSYGVVRALCCQQLGHEEPVYH